MPHYKDGTEAKPGDVVRGKGYNLKDENGELREIVGVLIGVVPNSEACNVTVLIPTECVGTILPANGHSYGAVGSVLTGVTEYGQADHFEKVE